MAKKNKQNTTANSILRRVFTPTEEDLALERKYGLDAIVRMLRREDVSQVLDQVLPYLRPEIVDVQKGILNALRSGWLHWTRGLMQAKSRRPLRAICLKRMALSPG